MKVLQLQQHGHCVTGLQTGQQLSHAAVGYSDCALDSAILSGKTVLPRLKGSLGLTGFA